jgi:hypothetical protein
MTLIPRTVLDPTPDNISDLAEYLMLFFGGDSPELWDSLGCVAPELGLRDDEIGRWWANDVCETAWTLYVRYRQTYGPDEHWAVKWRYKRDWLEWLPPPEGSES